MNPLLLSIINQLRERQEQSEKDYRDSGYRKPRRELRVDFIDADFYRGKKRIGSMGVIEAMEAIAEEVHRFEEFDLSEAKSVKLRDL